jgi:hypothetical protein
MVALNPVSGTVPAHSSSNAMLHLNSCCVPNGASSGSLAISSNDPITPLLSVVVNLNVSNVPPDAVTDLTVYSDGTDYRLAWSASAGATGYKVYRMDSYGQNYLAGTLLTPSPIGETTFTDPTGTPGMVAFYQVVSVR